MTKKSIYEEQNEKRNTDRQARNIIKRIVDEDVQTYLTIDTFGLPKGIHMTFKGWIVFLKGWFKYKFFDTKVRSDD